MVKAAQRVHKCGFTFIPICTDDVSMKPKVSNLFREYIIESTKAVDDEPDKPKKILMCGLKSFTQIVHDESLKHGLNFDKESF